MADMDSITRRLMEAEARKSRMAEEARRASGLPSPVDRVAAARDRERAQLDETRRLTREVVAKCKTRDDIDGWQLLLVGSGRKARRMAAYPIAQFKRPIRDSSPPSEEAVQIWLLADGRYTGEHHQDVMTIDDLNSWNHLSVVLKGLRDLADRLAAR